MAGLTFGLAHLLWPEAGTTLGGKLVTPNDVGIATVIGLATGVAVWLITSHYCAMNRNPVNNIAEQSKTGYATNIIAGLGLGMQSTAAPIICIVAGTLGAAHMAGLYGVAIAALGMLSTTGIQLAVDAYGPIADNAGGIAEMSHQAPEVRQRTAVRIVPATPLGRMIDRVFIVAGGGCSQPEIPIESIGDWIAIDWSVNTVGPAVCRMPNVNFGDLPQQAGETDALKDDADTADHSGRAGDDLVPGHPGRELAQDRLDRHAGAADHRLPDHDLGIDLDSLVDHGILLALNRIVYDWRPRRHQC